MLEVVHRVAHQVCRGVLPLSFQSVGYVVQLSGMGAAFCAGIAAGVYTREIFQSVRRRRLAPEMEETLRKTKRAGWRQAVEILLTRPGTE